MSTLAERIDGAIHSSGKTGQEIARALKVAPTTISRLRTGTEVNPKLQLLMGIARETGTPIAVLVGGSFEISAEDQVELQRFRNWIDRKLATVDTLREPNAEVIRGPVFVSDDRRVADRPDRIKTPFGVEAHLMLRALGVSMVGEGILPDDIVYAVADDAANATANGKLIACRVRETLFVKRLIVQHNGRYLVSADPRYRVIAVDEEGLAFEILGIVIGRSGRIGS